MKVSREQAAANRERVVETAARLFRQRGFGGVSIPELMKAAGLTHGGFYGQFASKQALEREACGRGVRASVAKVAKVAEAQAATGVDGDATAGAPALHRFIEAYLSADHRDNPEDGCAVAALAGDLGRCDAAIQRVFVDGVTGMAAELARADPKAASTENVSPDFAMLASIVGALVLARAVEAADPVLSARILSATKERLMDKN